MTTAISTATVADADAIAILLRDCWHATYSSFLSAETLAAIAQEWHHPDILRRQIANPKVAFLLARAESGVLVGVATVKTVLEGTVLLILRLYVHPSHQRQGIGSDLLRHAVAAFPSAERLELEVAEANPQGRAFWIKHGFQVTGRSRARVGETTLDLVAMERRVAA